MLDHFLPSVVVTRYLTPFTQSQGSQLYDLVNNYYARVAGAGTTVVILARE